MDLSLALKLSYQIPLTVVVIVMVYILQKFALDLWTLRGFRGPFTVPILGNCYTPQALMFMRFMTTLRKKYGEIFTFFALNTAYLVVCDAVVVRRILSDSSNFVKGYIYTNYFHLGFGDGLVTSSNEKHKVDRALFGKYFIKSNIARYFPVINELTITAVNELEAAAKKSKEQNFEEFFAILALRSFMQFAYSSTSFTREQELEFCHTVSHGSYSVGRLAGLGLPCWNMVPLVQDVKKDRANIDRLCKPLIDARREAIARGEEIDDVLQVMLTNNLSDKEIYDHSCTMVAAGHDTSAFFSSYVCYLLGCHQNVQDAARNEILSVIGDKTEITADDVAQLKYLQKVMMESLRLYAVIPMLSRKAVADTYIKEKNITIRAGTEILIPLFIMNRDPEHWEKPAEFNPDRFDGKSENGNFTSAKQGFFPFGYGSRACIGNVFAQMESSIFLCHILRKFRLRQVPGFKPEIIAGISLTTSNGIKINVEPL